MMTMPTNNPTKIDEYTVSLLYDDEDDTNRRRTWYMISLDSQQQYQHNQPQ